MKIRQNIRHFAAKQALTMPVIGDIATQKLVDLHVRIFGDRADPAHREERLTHLEEFFTVTFDTYVAALTAGFPEAEAREITHLQANFDFFNHGWTEMMEIPVDELEVHYDRYGAFFETHAITIDDPLGEFAAAPIAAAPSTPQRLDTLDHPHAEAGFADDVYVETDDGTVQVGGVDEPEEVDVRAAPGMQDVPLEE
jgi:hypothetical protein